MHLLLRIRTSLLEIAVSIRGGGEGTGTAGHCSLQAVMKVDHSRSEPFDSVSVGLNMLQHHLQLGGEPVGWR